MDFNAAIQSVKTTLKIDFELKDKQIECLKSAFEDKDLIAVLPTGYGKSLIFQAVPFLLGERDHAAKAIIVVTPINSIMIDQCLQLSQKGVKACALNYQSTSASAFEDEECGVLESQVPLQDIENNLYRIIYAHPESLLCTQGRKLVQRIKGNICAIAIDEAHITIEWGTDFRPDFMKLGSDFIPLFTQIPVMLFTATAPTKRQDELIKIMKLRNPVRITCNADRPNIKLIKFERPASTQQRIQYPITIFYTDTKVISYAYWFMNNFMGQDQYEGESKPETRLFGQYHKEYTPAMKSHIVKELGKNDSSIRLVFATVSLGMGLNAPAVRRVIHYKPPTSLEKYFQEIGRAGRDGLPSTATLYYNNTDIRRNRPGITKEIIDYSKQNESCRREFILHYFGHKVQEQTLECCDICDKF